MVLTGRKVVDRNRYSGKIQLRAANLHPTFGQQSLKDAFMHVILEVLTGEALVGIDPRDDEDRMPLVDRPLDERFLRIEVKDVELFDPRRHDQKGALEHLLCRSLILDQLHQGVLVDDLSRRDGEVLTNLEFRRIRLPDLELPASLLDIPRQKLHAADEILPIGGERLPQEFGTGENPIRRSKRVDDLLGIEACLMLGFRIESLGLFDKAIGLVRCDKIGLAQEVEELVLRPGRVLETIVLGTWGLV